MKTDNWAASQRARAATEGEVMYCRNCGKEVIDNAKFCPYCGFQANQESIGPGSQRPKNKTVLIIGIIAAASVVCCLLILELGSKPEAERGGTEEYATVPIGNEISPPEPEIAEIGFEWIVEPVFSYSDIICVGEEGVIARGNGIYIDQKTGKETGQVYGHGLVMNCLFYDENEGLYGLFVYGDGESSFNFYTADEFESWYTWIFEKGEWVEKPFADTLNIVYSIDSAKIDISIMEDGRWYEEYGEELIAIRDKGAVAFGKRFLTDFIYDGGERNGIRYMNNIIAVRKDGMWGIVDKNGKPVAPFVFEEAITIDDDTAFAKYEGKVGILNLSPNSPVGIVNTPGSVLNVRSLPDTSGDILGALEDKTKTIIRGEEKGFYVISYKGTEAYISVDFVSILAGDP